MMFSFMRTVQLQVQIERHISNQFSFKSGFVGPKHTGCLFPETYASSLAIIQLYAIRPRQTGAGESGKCNATSATGGTVVLALRVRVRVCICIRFEFVENERVGVGDFEMAGGRRKGAVLRLSISS